MDKKYLLYIANQDLTATEYKILLVLLTNTCTATQVSKQLGIISQNKDKYFKKLIGKRLIEVSHVDGRNKYYRSVIDMKKLEEVMIGQIKI